MATLSISSGDIKTVSQQVAGNGTYTIQPDAYIITGGASANGALGLVASGGTWAVTINGGIQATDRPGLKINGLGTLTGKLMVGAEGFISSNGTGANAVVFDGAANISNAGLIAAASSAVVVNSTSVAAISILNKSGAELVGLNGTAVIANSNGGAISFTNDGLVEGTAIFSQSSGMTFRNTGRMEGSVIADVAVAKTTFTNSGAVLGGVQFGAGADTVTNSGTIAGSLSLGGGVNKVTNSGSIQSVETSLLSATVTLANSGTIGNVQLAGTNGNHVITNSGSILGGYTGSIANDTLTNSGTISGDIDLFAGLNTLNNSKQIQGTVFGGLSGKDTVNNTVAAAVISEDVIFNAGENVLSNRGFIRSVTGGADKDTYTNFGTIVGQVAMGGGANTLTNSGTIGFDVFMGEGTNTLTNTKTIHGRVVVTGVGTTVTKLTNSGLIAGEINVFAGSSSLTNSGNVALYNGGSGIDTVKNTGNIGQVSLGDGDDVYTGGNNTDTVFDGNGLDKIALGGGDDLYIAVTGLIQDGVDVLDGGLNGTRGDTYDASGLGILMGINLDTVDHTEFSAFVAKGVATGASFNDSIKGFENAKGGSNADAIFGNAVANVLEGNNGSDLLNGYAGNDTLRGGAGSDLLQGGAGKDILEGGQDADRFVFTKLTDSGPLATERDRITDFVHGTDKIVMEHLDSDETVAGEQNGFAFIGMNAAFTGVEGQVRAIHVGTTATNGYTLVQADTDGDRRSDFTIQLTGIITLNSADFDFLP